MRLGYLGPEGTYSHQALLDSALADTEPVSLATLYDTVMAVQDGLVEAALVPIENSLEGSVDVTLDTLAIDAVDVTIVGEHVAEIRNCLIAAAALDLAAIEAVYSHAQANAQCAHFLRTRLRQATVIPTSSTAEAVRSVVAAAGAPQAALGNRLAAALYGGEILLEDVDDHDGNQTRFVWLARSEQAETVRAAVSAGAGDAKTSIVFWGAGDGSAGWLVNCLAELSDRGVSLTRIESRPRRIGLGHYMFFADFGGGTDQREVAEAIEGLRGRCEAVRVLGSYRAG
ncbi:MAG TPA: prephenate dehydratase [Solirubrobacteraceae bacterium]|nr:prephenate dehydratase [Solirubrobacteraceae bacterium]